MSKHTPGPWYTGTGIDDSDKVYQNGSGVAVMSGAKRYQAERDANAKLIAAAPDLLEALEMCITDHGAIGYRDGSPASRRRMDAITELARAAIAKATRGVA